MLQALKALINRLQIDQLELKPGKNVVSGKSVIVRMRKYVASEDRWYDLPELR